MKKLITLTLMLALTLSSLASCGLWSDGNKPDGPGSLVGPEAPGSGSSIVDKIPDGMTGEDVAKLLLAGERLGDKIIDGDDIFANGIETLRHLAAVAAENGRITFAPQIRLFLEANDAGDVYTEFDAISRNYEEFADMTRSIVADAETAASDIDYVKKHVRLLDVWISGGWVEGVRYFLHVDENSETILTDSSYGFSVCRRYKNEAGDDVYETYFRSEGDFSRRATYIKDKKYEFVIHDGRDRDRYQGISANKDKGYWEIIDFINDESWGEDQFSIGFIIMKDDICYRAHYNNKEGRIAGYKLTTADRSCDIINVNEDGRQVSFVLNLGAFTGFDKVVCRGYGLSDLYLKDGRILNEESHIDLGGEERVAWINGVYASTSAFGHEGDIMLNILTDSVSGCRETLLDLLDDWGLVCNYDMIKVYDSIDRAALESENAIKYITWNGYRIKDTEGLLAAANVEAQLFSSFEAEYESKKDLTEVDVSDKSYELLIKFAEATVTADSASYAAGVITVNNVSVSISDTLLMVEGEPYHVALALRSAADGSLVHLSASESGVEYGGESSFTVSAESITADVPTLDAGSYQLVAYIATSEGIRSSVASAVPFTSADGEILKIGNVDISGGISDGALTLTYAENVDVSISVRTDIAVGYAEFYDTVAAAAYRYGEPSLALIEIVGEDGSVTPLTGAETEIPSGSYRLAYSVQNGDRSLSGYVYVDYLCDIADNEHMPAE